LIRRREARAWELDIEVTSALSRGEDGLAEGGQRSLWAIVKLTCLIPAQHVFDQMLARNKVSNFENFQIEFEPLVDKDSRHVLVLPRGDGWVEKE
jgi:hypothetical protein